MKLRILAIMMYFSIAYGERCDGYTSCTECNFYGCGWCNNKCNSLTVQYKSANKDCLKNYNYASILSTDLET